MTTAKDENEWERNWWGDCRNTMGEELKQLVYARHMGLQQTSDDKSPAWFDMQGKSVIDIGGGPVSLLLKCKNLGKHSSVVDPTSYPKWVYDRYAEVGIKVYMQKGEAAITYKSNEFDEVWIYNCLQHVDDPEKIIDNARHMAPIVRLFEWIDIPPHPGHPHELTTAKFNEWLKGTETAIGVKQLNDSGCVGKALYGWFRS